MKIKKFAKKLFLGSIVTFAPLISGCGSGDPEEYVSENTSDIRGTWYKHGNSGGWYGPNKEWHFGWYYLKQYGNDIEGKYENELYTTKAKYNDLENVIGTINDNNLSLMKIDVNNIPFVDLECTIIDNKSNDGKLEKTSSKIERRVTPWEN